MHNINQKFEITCKLCFIINYCLQSNHANNLMLTEKTKFFSLVNITPNKPSIIIITVIFQHEWLSYSG
jgi:hypothetical protein